MITKYTNENVKTGVIDDNDVLYGPLNNINQLNHVKGFVERCPKHAKICTGAKHVGNPKGYFYAPTIICDLKVSNIYIYTSIYPRRGWEWNFFS